MSKYLIVNADDFGMCNSANEAIFDLFESGKLKSSTVMLPCAFGRDAAAFAAENPQYAIGVHLTMTSEWKNYRWKSLSGGKTLKDEEGFMWHNCKQVSKHCSLKDLELEIRAQLNYAYELGMKPSHADNHMGSLCADETGRFSMLSMTLRVCGEYALPFRLYTKYDKRMCPEGFPQPFFALSTVGTRHWSRKYKVDMPDYLLFPDWTDELKKDYEGYRKHILKVWSDIPDGITETFIHPAKETEELKSITGNWLPRVWEYRLMSEASTHEYLKNHGVTMISYRELSEIKKIQ